MFCEQFKAPMNATWMVDDNGISYKNDYYCWEEVSDLAIFNTPKSSLTNGVFTVSLRGKRKNLAYSFKDKERAQKAFDYMKSKLEERELRRMGIDPSTSNLAILKANRKDSLQVYQQNTIDEVMAVAEDVIPSTEKIYVALKGAFKEYLFCTDKMVYISKKGFMTGHTFGGGSFKMPYANITNAEVVFHLATGYFELSSGGLQNKYLNYWDNDGNSPQKAPNAIALTSGELKGQFEQAAHFILEKVSEAKSPNIVQVNQSEQSLADKIRDLKALVDEGLLTQEEFDAKKRQLLNI